MMATSSRLVRMGTDPVIVIDINEITAVISSPQSEHSPWKSLIYIRSQDQCFQSDLTVDEVFAVIKEMMVDIRWGTTE